MRKFLGLVTILSFAANAGATEWHNFGPRAMGMGGAAVALPNGPDTAYWNPGALGAPEAKSGLQVPLGVHVGVTGNVLKAANDLNEIADACEASGGAQTGNCSQAGINEALNELNASGSGVRADVGTGIGVKVGRAAFFTNNFSYIGAKPRVSFANNLVGNVQDNTSELQLRGISATEFGVGYGHEIPGAPGLYLGGAAKIISGRTGFYRVTVADEDIDLSDFSKNERSSIQPGLDVGAYWDASRTLGKDVPFRPRFGLTARNVNNPKFKNPDAAIAAGLAQKYSLQGNLRAGAAISIMPFWHVAVDGDLTRNVTALEGLPSQQLGVGTEINLFNRSWINIPLRAGLSRNVAAGGKNSASLGIGLNFLHFNVDAGLTSSPRTQQVQSRGENKKYPNDVQGGVQLAWLFGGTAALKPEATQPNFETKAQ